MLFPLLLALQAAAPTPAPSPAPCPDQVVLPTDLNGWFMRGQPGEIGKGFDLAPAPVETVTLATKVSRAGGAAVAEVPVAVAGTYRIALSAPAWIDVVKGGTVIASTAHGHGPACTGIAKIVEFPLVPGTYRLQLSGMQGASVRVLIVRKG